MRILILAGDGMLGHMLLRVLSYRHEVKATLRGAVSAYASPLFTADTAFFGVDFPCLDRLTQVLASFRPHIVINCVGIIKQRDEARAAISSIAINALLPHRLAALCAACGVRLIHFSTDCVFSGTKGMYPDDAPHDATDLYGRSKSLGEVGDAGALTLRTSIIGPELKERKSLLEWFLAQNGKTVNGFTRAVFSGFTTLEMARIVQMIVEEHADVHGIYNISAEPISKYDLLCLIRDSFEVDVTIEPHQTPVIDRSLDSSIFRQIFDYTPPSWNTMIHGLHQFLGDSAYDL